MQRTRILLVLFALTFMAIQVIGFMSGMSKHEDRVDKLQRQAIQYETRSAYLDFKSDPAVELRKEKARFRAETINFVIKVLVISGATAFVFVLMRPERGQ